METREYANQLFVRLFVSAGESAVTEIECAADWQRLLSYAGSVSSGEPNSGDNEKINANLAREYVR